MARKISFPENCELGIISGIGKLTPACGTITVPKGKRAALEVDENATDLSPLSSLGPDDLQVIFFSHKSKIPDHQLIHLKHLTGLEQIAVSGNQITDAGIDHLSNMTKLITLQFEDTQFTGTAKFDISTMPNMLRLYLSESKFCDSAIARISGLQKLDVLYLSNSNVTDVGINQLTGLPQLEDLDLSSTAITDASAPVFLRFSSTLRRLSLHATAITDASIPILSQLKLRELQLGKSRMSAAGVTQLKQLMRKCNVDW